MTDEEARFIRTMIIAQAVEDWVSCENRRRLGKARGKTDMQLQKDAERFFLSKWCDDLLITERITGAEILDALRKIENLPSTRQLFDKHSFFEKEQTK